MEFYTVDETARLLRVSPITIRRYIASGELEAVRVGRSVRVRREAIEHFMKPLSRLDPRSPRGRIGGSHPQQTTGDTGQLDNLADAAQDEVRLPTILESLGISVGIGRSSEPTNITEFNDDHVAGAVSASENGSLSNLEVVDQLQETADAVANRPIEADWEEQPPPGQLPTMYEALSGIIGIGRTKVPTNIAEDKDEYLADAYSATK